MFVRSAIVGNEIESAHWSCWVEVLCTSTRLHFAQLLFIFFWVYCASVYGFATWFNETSQPDPKRVNLRLIKLWPSAKSRKKNNLCESPAYFMKKSVGRSWWFNDAIFCPHIFQNLQTGSYPHRNTHKPCSPCAPANITFPFSLSFSTGMITLGNFSHVFLLGI